MKCLVCGRTESDFEKINNELIGQIDGVLKILYDKRKELKDKIKNIEENKKDKNHNGTALGKINNEIKMLNEQKEKIGKVTFVDFDLSDEILNNVLFNNCKEIIGKYLPENKNKMDKKICLSCETIINSLISEKIEIIRSTIDSIFDDDFDDDNE
jgi:hypothetical protein